MTRNKMETMTVGGGCFWCVAAVFEEIEGVNDVIAGFAGGALDFPNYTKVCTGETGHAEVVRITYQPEKISYSHLLEIFFGTHDPTTINQQGNDIGTQYRSIIFTHSDKQKKIAENLIAELNEKKIFENKIVTEVHSLDLNKGFWPAKERHQNYFSKHPGQTYCQIVVFPKVAKLRSKFAPYLKKQ